MAEKPRVKAPKQRSTPKSERTGQSRRSLLLAGVIGLVAVGVVAAVALAGIGGSTDARAALETAGCSLQVEPGGKPAHSIRDPADSSKAWNTDPPTNGPHYGVAAIFGEYDEALEQARVVHNLEHGGVFIQYGNKVPASTVQQLREFYADHTSGTLLAPYPSLGDKVALGAWVYTPEELTSGSNGQGYVAKCTTFDEAAFAAFLEEYQFSGSHVNDPDLLQPGH